LKNNNFEFSRKIDLNSINPKKIKKEELEANDKEKEALVERLGVKAVEAVSAMVEIEKVTGGTYYKVTGVAKANVVQPSVISMKDVKSEVISEFDTLFTLENEIFNADDGGEYELDDDENSPIYRGTLDIGELAVQYLSLDINPYPKLEGEDFDHQEEVIVEQEKPEKANPFSVLAKLKEKN